MKTILHMTLLNDLFGADITAHQELHDGFFIKHNSTKYPFAAVYQDPEGTYSVVEVISDHWNDIAIKDERQIKLKATVNEVVNAIKTTEQLIKSKLDSKWKTSILLWCEHFGLSVIDALEYNVEIKQEKRIYDQDLHLIKSNA